MQRASVRRKAFFVSKTGQIRGEKLSHNQNTLKIVLGAFLQLVPILTMTPTGV